MKQLKMLLLFASISFASSYTAKPATKPFNVIKMAHVADMRGCEVMCDGKEECDGFSFKDVGVVSQCILLSVNTFNQVCTAPITIYLKDLPSTPIYPSATETTVASTTEPKKVILRDVEFPPQTICQSDSCRCPDGEYLRFDTANAFFSGFVAKYSDNDWYILGQNEKGLFFPMGNKISGVQCIELSKWFNDNECGLGPVKGGFYDKTSISCPGGLKIAGTVDKGTLALTTCTNKDVLLCERGFHCLDKEVIIDRVQCN